MSKELKRTASIYIPHYGCPNDCVFCNQVKISGKKTNLNYDLMKKDMLDSIKTMRTDAVAEIAFFGGSFTAIEEEVQERCLELANEVRKELKRYIQIKMSTRPDAIDEKVIARLKKYGVDTVELGVQSLDDGVLIASNRCHGSECVFTASKMIKDSGILLGLQLMIGLPLDTEKKMHETVEKVLKIKPNIARIYPVLVIKDTKLEKMYYDGEYKPLDIDTTVTYAKYMYKKLENAGINVIRIGLQATDNITNGNDVVAGPFHSAFGELVIGEIFKDKIEEIVREKNINELDIYCHRRYISKILGNRKRNYNYFFEKYNIRIKTHSIDEDVINILNNKMTWKDFLIY